MTVERHDYTVSEGEEFIVPGNKWHGWETIEDSKVIQKIDDWKRSDDQIGCYADTVIQSA